jgi:nifR3 family TIM-barrel protein
VTSRAVVDGKETALRMMAHHPSEQPRSVQLYGVDPATIGAAVSMIGERGWADHVDLNFGCPAPKVTRKGGGAALPWKLPLFREIVGRATQAGGRWGIPVTVKMRLGIDAEHLTYMDAGVVAQEEGAAAVTLHARTAAQHYSGEADWDRIGELKRELRIPVLGNGDIFAAGDALAMMQRTGCDGVVIGRGCQGRPWLFADLAAAFAGSDERVRPNLGQVTDIIQEHAQLLVTYFGNEERALREMRGHMSWYFKGYPVGGESRRQAHELRTLADLESLFAELDLDAPYPGAGADGPRGRRGSPKAPVLPEGWLDSRELTPHWATKIQAAELSISGG